MEKAFKLNFKSGNSIEVHMKNANCELSVDDKTFSLSLSRSELQIFKKRDFDEEIVSSEEIESQTPSSDVAPLRRCINCQGRTYCITGGCANTPCGWICDY